MQPYLSDPFRGAVNRYVLGDGESSLTLETQAAKEALKAGKSNPKDIDLVLVASMFPDQVGVGNAEALLHKLGLNCPAWNMKSMHSGALIGLQTAYALIKTEEYQNILVVVSCTYSRNLGDNNTISWITGDGAGAFLVSSLKANQGLLGTKVINTAITNDVYSYKVVKDTEGNQLIRLLAGKNLSKFMRENTAKFITKCCKDSVTKAGVTLNEINFFVTSTPLAWFAELFINTLGIDRRKTLDMYPYYGNIGAALPIANLYYAAKLGKIKEGDLVLLFSIGGASTAAATVMRWGDVALGNAPDIELPISVSKSRIKEPKPDVSSLVTSS